MISQNESPIVDRQALAEQVIVSAANVLSAAGFTRAEISDFFRQAADQLQVALAPATEAAPRPDHRLAHVATEFSRHAAVQELHGLAAKAATLLPVEPGGDGLRDAFDLAMQAVPLLAEAQQALRALATDASISLVPNHTERERRIASGEEPGDEIILCLEDFEALYIGAFDIIGAAAGALAADRDSEAFTFLLAHLADNAVVLNPRVQAVFEEGARSLG